MRTLMAATMVVLIPSLAGAQPVGEAEGDRGLRHSKGLQVAVIDGDSREWQGRLLEVARDAITLEIGADARRFPLDHVKRVDARGDKIWDGALKGAAFGAIVGALAVGGRFALPAALSYGLVGLGLDALNDCNHTVYRAPARAAVRVSW